MSGNVENDNTKTTGATIVKVPPRRKRVIYKGLHGWIEYMASTKSWKYTLKLLFPINYYDEAQTENEITLKLKETIDQVQKGNNKHVRSID